MARGAVDLGGNRYRDLRLGIDLMKPPALFPNMTGRQVRLVWTLDGPFATANYSYRLTSNFVKFDNTAFAALRAEGQGRLSPWPMRIPLRLDARAIGGIGDVAGAILAHPHIEGWLTLTPKLLRGDRLKLTSAKINGKLSILVDLVTGRFEVLLSGQMHRYLIPGLGLVDVISDLRVVPGAGGHGSHVVGSAKVWVRRLDNSFFASMTGGLPRLTTDLVRDRDGIVHFSNLQLYSPKLRLSGSGLRYRDGTFHIVASGRQAKYGPLKLVLDGHIERPKVEPAAGAAHGCARNSRYAAVASAHRRRFRLSRLGGSRLGPFTSSGQICCRITRRR